MFLGESYVIQGVDLIKELVKCVMNVIYCIVHMPWLFLIPLFGICLSFCLLEEWIRSKPMRQGYYAARVYQYLQIIIFYEFAHISLFIVVCTTKIIENGNCSNIKLLLPVITSFFLALSWFFGNTLFECLEKRLIIKLNTGITFTTEEKLDHYKINGFMIIVVGVIYFIIWKVIVKKYLPQYSLMLKLDSLYAEFCSNTLAFLIGAFIQIGWFFGEIKTPKEFIDIIHKLLSINVSHKRRSCVISFLISFLLLLSFTDLDLYILTFNFGVLGGLCLGLFLFLCPTMT